MPAPRRRSHKHGHSPRRPSGGKLRKGPSKRMRPGSSKTEDDDEDSYAPVKNWTPHIIGGSVAGTILLIIILALVATTPTENGIDPNDTGPIGINELQIETKAKRLSTEAQRLTNVYYSVRTSANRQQAVETIHAAIAQWNILLDRHQDSTYIQNEICILNDMLIGLLKMPPLE